ncbi:MAG: alpha/beta hydrolase [Candidatus Levybacteria bacterium]|nr:alpha/beta hydrolase [Candidatus Levybacteria bacterium]
MTSKNVTIKSNGYSLSGTIFIPDNKKTKLPAVIFYHGMVSQSKPRYNKRAEILAENGIAALTFDFRGCGESAGKIGELLISDWFDDAILAFDYLVNQPFIDKERVGVSGKSFGGYMASLVSAKRNIKSMVLQAPAIYADSWFDKPYLTTEEFEDERLKYRLSDKASDNEAIRAISKYKNPLLVVGSELDDTCPKNIVEGYFENCPAKNKKIHWIKGADHPLTQDNWNKEYTDLMTKWFKETL